MPKPKSTPKKTNERWLPFDDAEAAAAETRDDLRRAIEKVLKTVKAWSFDLALQEFLFWIFAIDKTRQGARLSRAQICERLRVSESTAKRLLARATDLGLLSRQEVIRRGGQDVNAYSIDWLGVRKILSLKSSTFGCSPEPPVVPIEPPPVPIDPPVVLIDPAYNKDTSLLSSPSSRNSPTLPSTVMIEEVAEAVEEVCKEVIAEQPSSREPGLRDAEKAMADAGACDLGCIKSATARGVTASEVIALVAFWRSTNLGVGALVYRVRNAMPGVPASERWPSYVETVAKAKASPPDQTVSRNMELGKLVKVARSQGLTPDEIDAIVLDPGSRGDSIESIKAGLVDYLKSKCRAVVATG